ncbi:hypothetical protein ACJX0J_008687, partial [Zea mays]
YKYIDRVLMPTHVWTSLGDEVRTIKRKGTNKLTVDIVGHTGGEHEVNLFFIWLAIEVTPILYVFFYKTSFGNGYSNLATATAIANRTNPEDLRIKSIYNRRAIGLHIHFHFIYRNLFQGLIG